MASNIPQHPHHCWKITLPTDCMETLFCLVVLKIEINTFKHNNLKKNIVKGGYYKPTSTYCIHSHEAQHTMHKASHCRPLNQQNCTTLQIRGLPNYIGKKFCVFNWHGKWRQYHTCCAWGKHLMESMMSSPEVKSMIILIWFMLKIFLNFVYLFC